MSSEQESSNWRNLFGSRGAVVVLGVLIVVSLIAVAVLGYLLARSGDDDAVGGVATPTPFAAVGPGTASPPGGGDALVVGVSDTTTVSVTLDMPVSLNVTGNSFGIVPQTINPNGTWSPGLEEPGNAGWVFGSIVNYLTALRATDENQALLESLSPGSQITLTTQSGNELNFEFDSRRLVPVNDQSIFSQQSPGISLVLLNAGGDERLVVRGRYVLDESASSDGPSAIEVGDAAQLGSLQIVVTGATYVPDHPSAPPGFAFYLVEYQIQNVGQTPIDVSQLQLVLTDATGNQYALNPVAAQLGTGGQLTSSTLNPGESTVATAGYQVPEGLSSVSLTWTVVRRDTGEEVQVTLPFTGADGAEAAAISLQSVEVTADLNNLVLSGQIVNQGEQPLVVGSDEVTLRTPDGASYLVLSTNPPFPWTVPPGQTLLYVVSFQRPQNAPSAIFTILNQSYQLDNLQP